MNRSFNMDNKFFTVMGRVADLIMLNVVFLICCLPISGEYPKDIAIFPDDQHIASLNHETGSITFFHIDYEKGLLVGSANPVRVDEPNCCAIVKVRG